MGGNQSGSSAFRAVYTAGVTFNHVDSACAEGCWGRTVGASEIRIYGPSTGKLDPLLIAHELGHAFNALVTNILGARVSPYDDLAATWRNNPGFPRRADDANGFASDPYQDTKSWDTTSNEEFADMFIGWAYNKWQEGPAGDKRSSWMSTNMSEWVTMLTIRPDQWGESSLQMQELTAKHSGR
jgi:hypothetical protein